MRAAELERDAPACACGYSLIGLTSGRCPECGAELGPDLSAYRPSRSGRTPWSAVRPRWLFAGFPLVFARPLRSFDACASPQRVTLRRAAAFGASAVVLLVLCWPAVRSFIEAMLRAVERGTSPWLQLRAMYRYSLLDFRTTWWRLWVWESWSLLKWLLFFPAVAMLLPARRPTEPRTLLTRPPRQERMCRLLLFAPWLAVLEVGLYLGVSLTDFGTVAEPSTTFGDWTATFRHDLYATWHFWAFWLGRTVPSVGVVGFVFFRGVTRWRLLPAVAGAAALVLPAVALQITGSDLWLRWELRRLW